MKYVEAEGDTIDAAISMALSSLGVTRDRVEIEILSSASRGLFGIGGRKARVKATLRAPLSAEIVTSAEAIDEPAPVSRPLRPTPRESDVDVDESPASTAEPMLDAATIERALQVLRAKPPGVGATRIGGVTDTDSHKVLLKSSMGVQRILDMASGEQLPRIC